MAAWIAPLISAGFGIGQAAKGPSQAQKDSQNILTSGAKTATDAGKGLLTSGADLTKSGIETTAPAKNYFTGLLGNRDQALASAVPEISTILDQFDQAHRSAAEFSPRGGGRATANGELPYKQAGLIGQILSSRRAGAAGGLASLGLDTAGLGVQETGAGIGGLGVGERAGADLGRNEQAYQAEQNKNFAGIGSGIGTFLGSLFGGPK